MRRSHNPFPSRSKEEENWRIKRQAASKSFDRFLFTINPSNRSSHGAGNAQAFAAALPLIFGVALLAAPFIYVGWVAKQIYKSPSHTCRNIFLKQELWRMARIGSCVLPLYLFVDWFSIHNHRWTSLICFPISFFVIIKIKKSFKKSKQTNKNEEKKWHSRRRRKLARNQVREQDRAA